MAKGWSKVKEIRVGDDPERAARLAEALRANLRRRKAQQRTAPAADDAPRTEPREG